MTGAGVELGKLSLRCKGRRSSGEPVRARVPMRSTVAESCSSDEGAVMAVEQRHDLIRSLKVSL